MHQLFERVGRRVGKRHSFFSFSQTFLTHGVPEVLNDKVSGYTANESGELLRFSNVSPSDLFKYHPQGFLVEVIDARGVTNASANDNHYGATVTLNQLGLGLLIALPNAADEIRSAAGFIYGWNFHSIISAHTGEQWPLPVTEASIGPGLIGEIDSSG
jgi:hypothetical protein